jgi:peroxiredoxin
MRSSPIKSWKDILTVLVLVAVAVGVYFVFSKRNRLGPELQETWLRFKVKVGDRAPDFSLPTLKGNSARLADYRGKVVFLNFWATWCPPCRDEMPSMEALYKRLQGRAFEMLAVSIDTGGEDVVREFVTEFGMTFPVLPDPKNELSRLYGLTGVPETYIIDKDGVVALKIIGARDWMGKEWLDYFDQVPVADSR